jgi:hypothetical protein
MAKKIYNEVFDFLNINDDLIKKDVINVLESRKGPTVSSNWLTENILIGKMPKNCNEVIKIINSGVTMFVSLREHEEEYQKCIHNVNEKYKESVLFFRFDIPDFGTRDTDSIKALIDSIINYINIKKEKVMIHCLGGHGRTGTVSVPLIAILLFFINITNKNNKNFLNRDDKKTFNEWNILIDNIAQLLFIQAQSYVMISLRKDRLSNSIKKKEIKKVRVPETHAQDIIAISVIKKYIINYLENGEIYNALK